MADLTTGHALDALDWMKIRQRAKKETDYFFLNNQSASVIIGHDEISSSDGQAIVVELDLCLF